MGFTVLYFTVLLCANPKAGLYCTVLYYLCIVLYCTSFCINPTVVHNKNCNVVGFTVLYFTVLLCANPKAQLYYTVLYHYLCIVLYCTYFLCLSNCSSQHKLYCIVVCCIHIRIQLGIYCTKTFDYGNSQGKRAIFDRILWVKSSITECTIKYNPS